VSIKLLSELLNKNNKKLYNSSFNKLFFLFIEFNTYFLKYFLIIFANLIEKAFLCCKLLSIIYYPRIIKSAY
jgi:hypothetical protein